MLRKVILPLVVMVLATVLVRQFLVGNYISLGGAPALAGTVSQSMYGGNSNTGLLVAGKDFYLGNVTYFDQNNWVVAKVTPIHNGFDPGIVVMQKQGDTYVTVLGPGTDFDISFLQSLPNDVGQYLTSLGIMHGPTN